MEEAGKFDKPTATVPTFYSLESKDNTQVVYIYSTSSDIKREPTEQHQLCSQDDVYNTKPYRNDSHVIENSRANSVQRRNPDASRADQCGSEIDSELSASRNEQFLEYTRSWGGERGTDYGDMPEGFGRQKSPTGSQKPRYESKNPAAQKLQPRSIENYSKIRPTMYKDKGEEGKKIYTDGSYPYNFPPEKRKRDYYPSEQGGENAKFRGENFASRYEEHLRIGRKSFTPIKIYPSSKDRFKERQRYFKRHEYVYDEPPPNVTLVSQDYHNRVLMDDKEQDDKHLDDEDSEKDSAEAKQRSYKLLKSEVLRDSNGSVSRLHRSESEEFRGRSFAEKYNDERYEVERLHPRMGKERMFHFEKNTSRTKNTQKHYDHQPDLNDRLYISHSEDVAHSSPPTDYLKFAQRDKSSRFECEIPADKGAPYRFIQCYGGHEYDGPRKCERYSEMKHEMEFHQEGGRSFDRRSAEMHLPEIDEKIITDQKGYLVPAYQRCCCPCCPCYSIFRQAQRGRSPVSPRHSPPKPPVSPKLAGRSQSHPENEPSKSRPSPIVQQMPAELQLKMVARGLPHLRRRRNRTVYTHDQIEELEEVFKIKHYLDVDEKSSIAKRLGIRTENVEIWFKNRRAKWRKEMKNVKSNSDGEICQYVEEEESNLGENNEGFGRKPLASILSKDIPEERPTMTLYHTGQGTCVNDVDSTVVGAAAN